jgi:hypothetical protein
LTVRARSIPQPIAGIHRPPSRPLRASQLHTLLSRMDEYVVAPKEKRGLS